MRTKGEQHLVGRLTALLKQEDVDGREPRILHIGPAKGLVIENQLVRAGCHFTCDRLDAEDCAVSHPCVEECWSSPVERMSMVKSNAYEAALANYVLEHVTDPRAAAEEILRVLKPGGIFLATVPNVAAPEFRISRVTPLWFHRLVRGRESWQTTYLYGSIAELARVFENAGFKTLAIELDPCMESYLERFPVLSVLGKLYDRLVSLLSLKWAMGDVCMVFRKGDDSLTPPARPA
jgi:SAM-dependent methyltransferase